MRTHGGSFHIFVILLRECTMLKAVVRHKTERTITIDTYTPYNLQANVQRRRNLTQLTRGCTAALQRPVAGGIS